MFKVRKRKKAEDAVEQTFNTMMRLIKDLPKADYKRLKDAMDLGYDAYQKVRNVKTIDEKDTADISEIEGLIETERKKNETKE